MSKKKLFLPKENYNCLKAQIHFLVIYGPNCDCINIFFIP